MNKTAALPALGPEKHRMARGWLRSGVEIEPEPILGFRTRLARLVTIDGVRATYEPGPIKVKWGHLSPYPVELYGLLKKVDDDRRYPFRGPSIAAILNERPGDPTVEITKFEAIGFEHHPAVISPKNSFKGAVGKLFR